MDLNIFQTESFHELLQKDYFEIGANIILWRRAHEYSFSLIFMRRRLFSIVFKLMSVEVAQLD